MFPTSVILAQPLLSVEMWSALGSLPQLLQCRVLVEAAKAAGCKHDPAGSPLRCMQRGKPYFDPECRRMQARFRNAMKTGPQHVRVLARQFYTTSRRRCRQHRQWQTQLSFATCVALTSASGRSSMSIASGALPAALARYAAWDTFHHNICAPPAVLQPPMNPSRSTYSPSPALEAAITQQEIELALPKLLNGKAVGGAGRPAELLENRADRVSMDVGSRDKVWILGPLRWLHQPLLPCCGIAALHLMGACHSHSQRGLHPCW